MATKNAGPLSDDVVLPVDRLTFLVPSRAFHVSGTLLRGGYISLATEFALRLLRDADALTPGEISAFLGFSDLETRALIQELILDGYLDVVGNALHLSSKGARAFDPVSGDLKLLKIEPFESKVTLDLVGFAPVESEGTARLPWVPELEIPDRQKAAACSEAGRQGFKLNFGEWRDRNLRGDGGPPIGLHKLDDVIPLARSTTAVTIPLVYAPSRGAGVEPDFSTLWDRGRRGARDELIGALNDAIRGIVAPRDGIEAMEFAERWDDGAFCAPGGGVVDPVNWIRHTQLSRDDLPKRLEPAVRMYGSLTSSDAWDTLSTFLEGVPGEEVSDVPLFWVPSEHAAWGASGTLLDVARQLKAALSPRSGFVFMPRSAGNDRASRELTRAYGSSRPGRPPLFDNCIAVPSSAFPLSLELLVQPGLWGAVFLHLPSAVGGFPVAVGYATRNSGVVSSICGSIAEVMAQLPETSVIWADRQTDVAALLVELERILDGGSALP